MTKNSPRKAILIYAFVIAVLVSTVLLTPRSRVVADEQKATSTAASAEGEQVLQQLRLKLPNKTDDEIIQSLRGYVPDDKTAQTNGMSWFTKRLQSAKTQKEAVEAIQRSAGLVFYDYQIGAPGVVVRNSGPPGPAALRSLLGDDFVAVVIEASLGNGGIEQVGRLPHLRRLNISVPIKDADLVHVEGLSELRELDLGGLSITDAGLEHLRFLKQLQYLGIWGTKVTNAGLRHLKALSELRRLNLSDTRVTDAGLQYVMQLPQLQELDLTSTKVTDEGVAKLQQTLPNCKITR